jgi:hypothetical protein
MLCPESNKCEVGVPPPDPFLATWQLSTNGNLQHNKIIIICYLNRGGIKYL